MHSERGPQIADVGVYSDGDVQVAVEASQGPGPMADVFISYAKADRPLALKLAAMLEPRAGRSGGTQVSPSVMNSVMRLAIGDNGRRSPERPSRGVLINTQMSAFGGEAEIFCSF